MDAIGGSSPQLNLHELVPVIPTMDVVIFPHMIVPLLVLDERIITGIELALQTNKIVLLLAARKQSTTQAMGSIGTKDLYSTGTVGTVMRIIKIPDGGVKVLVQGTNKARADNLTTDDGMLRAQVVLSDFLKNEPHELEDSISRIKHVAEKMGAAGQTLSPDFHIILSKINDPEKIADFILSHLNLSVDEAQLLLESTSHEELLERLYIHLAKEIEVSEVQERVKNRARESMNRSQKEYYLREQLKAIKKELGEDDAEEIDKMREKLESLNLASEVQQEVLRQINRLEKMTPDSMEATVTRTYLDWVFALPWGIQTTDNLDLAHAKSVLDADHYGLAEVKDRILDFISIRILKSDGYNPILCLVGPPGTGKTSLGASIAKSLGRNVFRVSLGGVKDEAEIRGHRRTYVGAMPGRFIQGIRKSGSMNPVIIVDEIDKIGADFRGDPSAAMLEVLDPQQNKTFYDNYLGFPFDLSQVLFIATANTLDTISEPLKDRMDIISLSGYSHEEKVDIAQRYICKRALQSSGLTDHTVLFDGPLLTDIITYYTRESGVRQLDRVIQKVCSKMARAFVEKKQTPMIARDTLEQYLGPRKFLEEEGNKEHKVGVTNGLAWTAYGGEMIRIEAVLLPGRGRLILTGQLGSVMKESAQAALSYARAHAKHFGIDKRSFTDHDLHIHVPAGAVPKDGPSAGITMLSSILSVLTSCPIDSRYAMTGELDLHGDIMPIGGVKEKILAAKRNGVTHLIFPDKNKNDVIGLEDLIKDIDIIWVSNAQEVIHRVLMRDVIFEAA